MSISKTAKLAHRLVGENKWLSLYTTVMVGWYAALLWQSIMDIGSDAGIIAVLENL